MISVPSRAQAICYAPVARWELAMLTTEQARRQAIIKEAYVGIIGWGWIAASLACMYFLAAAIFFGRSWWQFFASAAGSWLLFKISLYYRLESECKITTAANVEWSAPLNETFYLYFKNGKFERVHIPEGVDNDTDLDAFARQFNSKVFGDDVIVRIVSMVLQKQRLATGRDGTVWPKTPPFDVHFSDGVVSSLNIEPSEIEGWATQWRSFSIEGDEVRIESICDDEGFVIWPERDGSRILWR